MVIDNKRWGQRICLSWIVIIANTLYIVTIGVSVLKPIRMNFTGFDKCFFLHFPKILHVHTQESEVLVPMWVPSRYAE